MKRYGMILLAVLALIVGAGGNGVRAQQANDSVAIKIQGMLNRVHIDSIWANAGHWHVGDTIHFLASATDADGDPVDAIFTWTTSDSTVLKFPDASKGDAIALAKSQGVVIYVLAQQVDNTIIGYFRPGIDSAGSFTPLFVDHRLVTDTSGIHLTAINQTAQLCGYLTYQGTLVAMNQADPGQQQCPYAFGGPEPVSALVMAHFGEQPKWLYYAPLRSFLEMAAGEATGP